MNKTITIILAAAVAASAGAFYGGMKYAESRISDPFARENFQDFRNLSPEERRQIVQQSGLPGGGRVGGQPGTGSISGEILSRDEQSLTVKLRDGGSKIIFLSESTEIVRSVPGSPGDLATSTQIFVAGDQNQDGSVTARTIQIP